MILIQDIYLKLHRTFYLFFCSPIFWIPLFWLLQPPSPGLATNKTSKSGSSWHWWKWSRQHGELAGRRKERTASSCWTAPAPGGDARAGSLGSSSSGVQSRCRLWGPHSKGCKRAGLWWGLLGFSCSPFPYGVTILPMGPLLAPSWVGNGAMKVKCCLRFSMWSSSVFELCRISAAASL